MGTLFVFNFTGSLLLDENQDSNLSMNEDSNMSFVGNENQDSNDSEMRLGESLIIME